MTKPKSNANTVQEAKVLEATEVLIHEFFKTTLALDHDAAHKLRLKYLKEYGLIIEGLAANNGVNPLDFNRVVDDALPLEELIRLDPEITQLFQDIDRTKVKLWLFTSAYINHARRVIRILGIGDHFDGLTYCDYGASAMRCKPHIDMFNKAM
ncbi:hypothetical protein EK21DRAFT_114647 [Setomelanomma holmii]|uniref:Uncharacterized protein n=1 Tax=Setomelanomma holmii TaxID=210430 RepID=A0A9P4H5M8_9PLEO|nr:hypothetical protein EK21DRAFT_114647 [Setomelanomma holmii]